MFGRSAVALLVCLLLGPMHLQAQTQASCTFKFFTLPGFEHTFPQGVNRYGNVVGEACVVESPNGCLDNRGFIRYADGSVKTLLAPSSSSTFFNRRNANGVTVGGTTTTTGKLLGIVYNGFWQFVEFPGAAATRLMGINLYNTIVGQYEDAAGLTHSFKLKGGRFTPIAFPGAAQTHVEAISDTGIIVGWIGTPEQPHGFVLTNGVYTRLDNPAGPTTALMDINAQGVIVGVRGGRGFLYKNGVFKDIVVPGATFGGAGFVRGINGFSVVTGNATINATTTGFVGRCQ